MLLNLIFSWFLPRTVDQRFLSWYFDFSLKPNKICSSKTIAFYIFAYYTSFPVLVQSNDWWTIQTFGFVPKHSIDFEKENLFFVKVWSLLIVSFKVIEELLLQRKEVGSNKDNSNWWKSWKTPSWWTGVTFYVKV